MGGLKQNFFHCQVGQTKTLREEMSSQHRCKLTRQTSSLSTRRARRNQRHQLSPLHHESHYVKEFALSRPLGLAHEAAIAQAHFFHCFIAALPAPEGRFCRYSLIFLKNHNSFPESRWIINIIDNFEMLAPMRFYIFFRYNSISIHITCSHTSASRWDI